MFAPWTPMTMAAITSAAIPQAAATSTMAAPAAGRERTALQRVSMSGPSCRRVPATLAVRGLPDMGPRAQTRARVFGRSGEPATTSRSLQDGLESSIDSRIRRSRSASNCGCSTETATDCGYGQWAATNHSPESWEPVLSVIVYRVTRPVVAPLISTSRLSTISKPLQPDLGLTDERAHGRGGRRVLAEVAGDLLLLHGVRRQPEALVPRRLHRPARRPGRPAGRRSACPP